MVRKLGKAKDKHDKIQKETGKELGKDGKVKKVCALRVRVYFTDQFCFTASFALADLILDQAQDSIRIS